MECFIRVRVIRWQDWEGFFARECATRLIECAGVLAIKLYRDDEDPSTFGYKISYKNHDEFMSYFNSEEFEEVLGSQGSCWEILMQTPQESKIAS